MEVDQIITVHKPRPEKIRRLKLKRDLGDTLFLKKVTPPPPRLRNSEEIPGNQPTLHAF